MDTSVPLEQPGLQHVDLDQAYNEHQNFNLRDARFVQGFTGHLQDSPPISAWFSESFGVIGKNLWGFIIWTIFHVIITVVQIVPNSVTNFIRIGLFPEMMLMSIFFF